MAKILIYVVCHEDGCWEELSFKEKPDFDIENEISTHNVVWIFKGGVIDHLHPDYDQYCEELGIENPEQSSKD
tara:strand:- start:99921 stop:100139 length:219 start_codon:yes stop_codon:yes gene_type:complete